MKFKWLNGHEKEIHANGIFKGIIHQHERPDTIEFDSKDIKDLLQQFNRDPEVFRTYFIRLRTALKIKD